jgi:hypothetical protein
VGDADALDSDRNVSSGLSTVTCSVDHSLAPLPTRRRIATFIPRASSKRYGSLATNVYRPTRSPPMTLSKRPAAAPRSRRAKACTGDSESLKSSR